MGASRSDEVTQRLEAVTAGDETHADKLFEILHDELHSIASAMMANQPRGHTLQPTALMNEAYLKLVRGSDRTWRNQREFIFLASKVMRNVLVDHARGKKRKKRDRGGERQVLEQINAFYQARGIEVIALHESLERLSELDESKARLVELRFFLGYAMKDCARILQQPLRTVEREWSFARSWLENELGEREASASHVDGP